MADVQHVVVMGVSGSGKTTVARLVADRLQRPFLEADDLHPAANVAKMAAGTPLTDVDRAPWLRSLRDWLAAQTSAGEPSVLTCSALKVAYRDVLREGGPVLFVHLNLTAEILAQRMGQRTGHFMPPTLLASQLATLEPLLPTESGFTLDATGSADELSARIADRVLATSGV